MTTTTALQKIPTLSELVLESEESIKENNLMILLNQEPPKDWLKVHPTTNGHYLPIERVEYLLNRIFGKWWVEVKDSKVIANSVCVTVRVFVVNPVSKETEWNDGLGAAPIQTDKGAGAMDWNKAKAAGVQMALPSAESYAIKDACEKFGKLFGKDLNRKENISYNSLLKERLTPLPISFEDLSELFEMKKESLSKGDKVAADRILKNKEEASYNKLFTLLQSK